MLFVFQLIVLLIVFNSLYLLFPSNLVSCEVYVDTRCGRIAGFKKESYTAYLGVPFAEPPLNNLRFQPPQELHPQEKFEGRCWSDEVYDATYSRDMCSQMQDNKLEGSEDCLYLDIYTPNNDPAELSPVFVWIYGGSLVEGEGRMNPSYGSPKTFSEKNGVIVVSINYRLSVLGFLALPELSKHDKRGLNVSGNYGFLDVVQSLRWVSSNIQTFSGDPSKVTVFGQSTGGTLVLALLTSPLAKNLFSTAISMSASPRLNGTLEQSYEINYDTIIANSYCADAARGLELRECLYSDDYNTFESLFMAVQDSAAFSGQGGFSIPKITTPTWYPLLTIDGTETMPTSFLSAFETGNFNRVENIVIGVMREESDMYPGNVIVDFSSKDYQDFMLDNFNHSFTSKDSNYLGQKVLELYPFNDFDTPQQAYDQISTDSKVLCGNLELVRALSKWSPKNVYSYISPQTPSKQICDLFRQDYCTRYAFHMWDAACAFGNADNYREYFLEEDLEYGDIIRELFVDFTRKEKAEFEWIPFGEDERILWLQNMDKKPLMKKNPRLEKCKFWNDNNFDRFEWIN